jgi:hypothetical protein
MEIYHGGTGKRTVAGEKVIRLLDILGRRWSAGAAASRSSPKNRLRRANPGEVRLPKNTGGPIANSIAT